MVIALAWVYVRFGATPAADAMLYAIKPVVIAIVANALVSLGRQAITGPVTALAGLAVFGLYFLGFDSVLLLIGGGVAVMLVLNAPRLLRGGGGLGVLAPLAGAGLPAALTAAAVPFSFGVLFLTFLKIGAVLYGSGYTLLAFLEADFVDRLGWLTTTQLIDAVAIGQFTPGPVFTTATFVGFLLGGVPGAILATVAIFLPAFVFVSLSNPLIPRLRESAWVGGFLDGVNVCSLGLMAAVTIELSRAAFVDPLTVLIASISAVLIIRYRVNTTWLIAGAALVGIALLLLG